MCKPAARFPAASCALAAFCLGSLAAQSASPALPQLQASADQRFLVTAEGQPFFWLGDTAWELLHRLVRTEATAYLETRARQRFNVIQAVALAELDGLRTPNAHGDLPLIDSDPARPAVTPGNDPRDPDAYDYWDHVEFIVDEANRRGLYVALLPTWGAWAPSRATRDRHVVLHADNAENYGRFLGERFGAKGVIWILGGDRDATGHEAFWGSLARGITRGATGRDDYGTIPMTFHPWGGGSSATWFHDAPWLTFNLTQTGHRHVDDPERPTPWDRITRDYARTPVKPCLDGEPLYEDHPVGIGQGRDLGYALDAHVRQRAYWTVFSGGCGHTYGHHSVWQMYAPGRAPHNGPILTWDEALDRPGANQMRHLRALMESRPLLTRVPAADLVVDPLEGMDRIVATRGPDYAFIYSAQGRAFSVRLGQITGHRVVAWWFNPRTGSAQRIGVLANNGTRTFVPPHYGGLGADTVLVLDDATKNFPPPGEQSVPPLPSGPANPDHP